MSTGLRMECLHHASGLPILRLPRCGSRHPATFARAFGYDLLATASLLVTDWVASLGTL
jgi:hypothetical protein